MNPSTIPSAFHSSLVLPDIVVAPWPALMQQRLCAADRPLALLPVRLETRFFAQPGGGSELRVRVYPDKIHLDAHEPALLAGEIEWGQHFWTQDWLAGNDTVARQTAWSQLADRFGDARAAWIARQLAPTNPQQRPTAPATALAVAPTWPDVAPVDDGADSAWRSPACARLLPDHWIAVLQSGGRPVIAIAGATIVPLVAVGPDPRAPAPTVAADTLAVDAGMQWMVDFDAAEKIGMALRIAVPAATLAAGIDSLFVLGAAAALDADDGAAAFGALLDAHHYTDGLAFQRLGTPTNNTADRRSGYGANDPGHARSFATEILADPGAFDAGANAPRLGTALGLPTAAIAPTLGRLEESDGVHEPALRSMNTALWQVGWGYFLSNLVGVDGTGLTPAAIDWTRDHFVQHVRWAGPYPALRCGRQPYGVLPVTSLDLWADSAGTEFVAARDTTLRALLRNLRDTVWRPHLSTAPRVGLTPNDPDTDLANVMRTDALSSRYSTRSLFGRHYLQHLRAFIGEDLQALGFIAKEDALGGALLQRLGYAWRPRIAQATFAELAWDLSAPLVQAGEISPWQALQPNYIAALLAPLSIADLVAARPDAADASATAPLLQTLLRHAMLREIAEATARLAAGLPGNTAIALARDAELVDLVTGAAPTLTWKRQLDLVVPATTGTLTIRQAIDAATSFATPELQALGDFRTSLAQLQSLDTEWLQLAMQGTLDLSAHRLDAWITSFATKRLATMRAATPQGLYVGAYGWVENLRPATSAPAPISPLPAGEAGPLFAASNDSGFIHAPSGTHAAAAALLRNAHLGASGVPQQGGPFAIDLSSRRAREAERLLEGVRQGQPLGALLGYRFERQLHMLGLDPFILPLRRLAPLVGNKIAPSGQPLETVAADNVVDGLALFTLWSAEQATPPPPSTPVKTAINAEIAALGTAAIAGTARVSLANEFAALGDAIDGVSDALTAEAAYQIARGNTIRTAATLAGISQGTAPPPELEVTRFPRSGVALTHRVLALFGTTPPAAPGWPPIAPAGAASPRAAAEPMLDAWAATLFGDPTHVRCTVETLDDTSGAVVATHVLALSELALTPLDVLYGVDASDGIAGTASGNLSEVEQRLLHRMRASGLVAPLAVLRVQHARPADLAANELTLLDVLEQARAARRLLDGARGADPHDLIPAERADSGSIDLVDLETRTQAAGDALTDACSALTDLIAQGPTAPADALRAALLAAGGFGLAPAVPIVAVGDDTATRATLLQQAGALLLAGQPRLAQFATLRAAAPSDDPGARRDQLVACLRAVFGNTFVALPRFTCDPAAATELAAAIAASPQAQGGDPLAAATWLVRASHVREPLARLSACVRGAEVLGTGARLDLAVAQLPFDATQRWVGLPAAPGADIPPSKLSLVLQATSATLPMQPMTGLWIDEWMEVVPSRDETTALTFQFAPPDACAPQGVLLAVPPVPGQDWTIATLFRVLAETLDLAKLRALDIESLADTQQILPALVLAFNAADDAVSTDFAPLNR